MLDTFPSLIKEDIKQYVSIHWTTRVPKNKVSMANLSYRDKKTVLSNLLYKKENGKIKKIFIYIRKGLSKETPYDLYRNIIGKNNFNAPQRESYRGHRVELVSFSNDMGRIIVADVEIPDKQFYFTIWDINCRNYIEIE
jgi:hypothetical protein